MQNNKKRLSYFLQVKVSRFNAAPFKKKLCMNLYKEALSKIADTLGSID